MKKIISVLLVIVLLLGLCACGAASTAEGGAAAETTTAAGGSFRVGYGKADITPEGPVGMGGYGKSDQRISKGVLSYLYATCIAITDESDNTILVFGLDMMGCTYGMKYRSDVAKATGVPEENIMMSGSHTHSCPDYSVDTGYQDEGLKKFHDGLIKAAETAMEDRKDAKMYGGSIETEGMNFVRHYLMNDGTYAGDNFGSTASGYKEHVHRADPMLQQIKFVREGDNDIYLTNFQCHPHQTGGMQKYDISADVVGEYRTAMENQLGCEVLYLSGAGGNVNSHSRIKEEQATQDWKEWGIKLAEYAQQVEFTELQTGKVQSSVMEFTAEINHEDDAYADFCGDLYSRWSKNKITSAELKEIALKERGLVLNSPYHASGISSRAKLDATRTFDTYVFSFGDVGLVAFPGEQFDTNGVFIKENSPFKMTIIGTKGNGDYGYFPSIETYAHGSYECDTTKYLRGTAEKLADQFVEMLEEQYNNK